MSGVKVVSIDTETKDPLLEEKGPGTFRKDGYPVGIAIASEAGSVYLPIAHAGGGNMDDVTAIEYVRDILKRDDIEVVGAHLLYDLEWLRVLGIEVKGKLIDIQIAEALLDEEIIQGYSLEVISKKYLGVGKDEELLKEAASAYGIHPKKDLWQLPAKYVGAYAEGDVEKPLEIWKKQKALLTAQELMPVFEMECSLIPILLDMRFQGVRVDLEKASHYSKAWLKEEKELRYLLKQDIGWDLNEWSGNQIAKVCRQRGIQFTTTEKGNPSFDKLFLKHSEDKFFKQIQTLRSLSLRRNTYVDELIFGNEVNGRIHATFSAVRKDEGGTRTGRFSSSNPNLQQVPSAQRDKVYAPIIRSFFIPNEGEKWAKLDYSQQEPRILAHYAFIMKLRGADRIRATYIDDKRTDFYTLVAKTSGLERKPAKDLTLGICYGEGKDKIAKDLGVDIKKATQIRQVFDDANPFIKELSLMVMRRASEVGYIKTILGRHRHFDFWEPVNAFSLQETGINTIPVRGREAGEKKWPNIPIKRAYAYKALNALIQGSAADMTKAAMIMIYKELKRIPLMQVHDELNYSVTDGIMATSCQYRMENCVETTVPILADLDLGPHWK
jgi:DNA polymerase I-like protein with 3'-5' exonuclease and polymerase domains